MPCNCDHMEPSQREIKLSQVACFLDELNGIPLNRAYLQGHHPRVYNQTYDKYGGGDYDEIELTKELVNKIKKIDISQHSLEMQIWWRDYQERQQEKKTKEEIEAKKERETKNALKKLTKRERELLGLL